MELYICVAVPANNTESGSLSRKKRSVATLEQPANNQTLTNISIAVVTTGCRVYDESTASWNPNGCTVRYNFVVHFTISPLIHVIDVKLYL
jgi:hypothetical protein